MSNITLTEISKPEPATAQPVQDGNPQVGGLCFPSAPADDIDLLIALSVAARHRRMLAAFASSAQTGKLGGPLLDFLRSLETTAATDILALFDSAVPAHLFAWKPVQIVDDRPYQPAFEDFVRWLLAAAAEKTAAPLLVSPPLEDRGLNYLFFRDQAALLHIGSGPVAILSSTQRKRIVCSDGKTFTLPGQAATPPGIYAAGAVQFCPRAAGVPVLNGYPDFVRFSPPQADHQSTTQSLPAVSDGFQLLAAVWPTANAFAERWMRAIIVLAYEGCSRSHTSVHAPQTLMCSAESPVKVAEAVCHEFSHARMLLFMERNAIIEDKAARIHRSPWRRDMRPMIGLINGVHAFVNVCQFYRRLAAFDPKWEQEAERVATSQRPKIEAAWHYARQNAAWTEAGERVAKDLDRAVNTL